MDKMPTKFKITSYFKCDDFQSYELKSCNLEQANLEADTIYFLMSKSCYWFASYLSNADKYISICPVCINNKIECLLILDPERDSD